MVDLAKPSTPWKRYSFICAGILLICAVLGLAGKRFYRKWEPARLATSAEAFLAKKDYKSAILTTRRGFTINQNSVECYRVMARIADELGVPEAVSLRQRAAALAPQSSEATLDLAETAMRFGEMNVAGEALAKVDENVKQTLRYHVDLGGGAAALNKLDLAADAYEKALKMVPADANLQLQYASVLLRRNRPGDREAARVALKALEKEERFRLIAQRLLLNDAFAHGEFQEALRMARELVADPKSIFDDKIVLLTLLQSTRAVDLSPFFNSLKPIALDDGHAMAALVLWMNRNGKAAEALDWTRQTPENLTDVPNVNAALGLCYLSVKDWAGLETFATDMNWGDLDFLRLAFLARAVRENGKAESSLANWRSATDLAIRQPHWTMALVTLSMEWGWDHEAQDLLSRVPKLTESEKQAQVTLYRRFAQNRDTGGLLEASEKMLTINPEDDRLKNDFAMYSLLLKHNVADARAIAKELLERHSSDPAYISTYAFSLFANADFENALKVMNTMRPAQLKIPEMAGYYAVFLCANRQDDEAIEFFDLAKGGKFLPEEEELIERSQL